MKKTSLIYWS